MQRNFRWKFLKCNRVKTATFSLVPSFFKCISLKSSFYGTVVGPAGKILVQGMAVKELIQALPTSYRIFSQQYIYLLQTNLTLASSHISFHQHLGLIYTVIILPYKCVSALSVTMETVS
jgi:hypothetical protein